MWKYRTYGIPDEYFIRSEAIPMTKEEIRSLTISKARIREGDTVVDVGSGTGSLSIEAAHQVGPKGKVIAIDNEHEAVNLTKQNVERFGVQHIVEIIHGTAPDAMKDFKPVDAVLVGGGSGVMKGIVQVSADKLKTDGHIVINSILIETGYNATEALKEVKFKDIEVINVSIATGKKMGWGTMMLARNPVTIICGSKP